MFTGSTAFAAPPELNSAQISQVDRTVVRYFSSETGGPLHPHFIFERELAFESRLEALSDRDRGDRPASYLERHVRAALERHVAEDLLSNLTMDPEATPEEVARRAESARDILEAKAGGKRAVSVAMQAEGIDARELDVILRRQARASLYLDRMVAPMLDPSDAELREVHYTTATPFRGQKFDAIAQPLRQWYVAQKLNAALTTFFQNTRSRVTLTLLTPAAP